MYSAWIITIGETGEEKIIWGEESKVNEYKQVSLDHEDFGGGFTDRTIEEIKAIVDGLKNNHPNAIEVAL